MHHFVRKLVRLLYTLVGVLTLVGAAQAAPWTRTLQFAPNFALPTIDGGFIVTGSTVTGSTGFVWMLKFDSAGAVLWQKSYRTPQSNIAYLQHLAVTADGGYVGVGRFRWADKGDDLLVLKFDANGNVVWQNAYNGTGNGLPLADSANSVRQTTDGGYIVAGGTGRLSAEGGSAFWALKLDASGGVRWQKAYGGAGEESVDTSVLETGDGGYVLAGTTSSFGLGAWDGDVWLVKLDAEGNLVWQKTYGGTKGEIAFASALATDGGFIIAASTSSFGASFEAWLLRLDFSGNIVWQRTYRGADEIKASSIIASADGNYILVGTTRSAATTDHFGLVMKLDASGNILWQKRYGAESGLVFDSARPASGGGLIVSGYNYLNNTGIRSGWVLLLDADGEAADCISTSAWNAAAGNSTAQPRTSTGVAFVTNATPVSTTFAPGALSMAPLQACNSGEPTVVEFYHASFDHYFITWMPDEIDKLDAGAQIKGWTRTGYGFKTYTSPQSGTSPVCRYYIPPALGDSHFFGRGTVECNATGQKNPSFVLEDPSFMHMFLPVAGVCPANTIQVYRVFSNRPDANHRYMTSKAVRDQMVAKGWLAEGDGPDLVVMCAPQ